MIKQQTTKVRKRSTRRSDPLLWPSAGLCIPYNSQAATSRTLMWEVCTNGLISSILCTNACAYSICGGLFLLVVVWSPQRLLDQHISCSSSTSSVQSVQIILGALLLVSSWQICQEQNRKPFSVKNMKDPSTADICNSPSDLAALPTDWRSSMPIAKYHL